MTGLRLVIVIRNLSEMNKIVELLLKDARENHIRRDGGASWKEAPCQFCDLAEQEYLFRNGEIFKTESWIVRCPYCLLGAARSPKYCIYKGRSMLEAMESYFED